MFRIGIDFDGLLWDLASLKHRALFELFGKTMPKGRERMEFMVADGVLTETEYWKLVSIICETPRYLEHMQPLDRMSTNVPRLRTLTRNVELRIITARRPEGAIIAQRWIDSHCLGLKVESSNDAGSKAPHADGLHVFVDDSIEHLHEVEGIVPHRFLFHWPYNEMEQHDSSIVRVHSWNDLYEQIRLVSSAYSKE